MKHWLIACVAIPFAVRALAAVTPEQAEEFFSGRGALEFPAPSREPASFPASAPAAASKAKKLIYTIVKVHPHDTAAFTEGLFFHDGYLYESVGMEGQSEVRKVDVNTGRVVSAAVSPDKVFGEGVALAGARLIQLTYTEGRAFVYDFATMRLTGEFQYKGEGWGLTTDGLTLIMSDGSDSIAFRDPETFAARRKVRVTLNGKAVKNINELEYVEGAIWANVWKDDRILRIDPASGRVTGVLNMAGLLDKKIQLSLPEPDEDVLNGIAYDPASGHFFVTGKCWPSLYEIAVSEGD
ncbi:MAG: glutaminyl-peptide cyclotransferase [Elusimicrobiota bacterium]